MERAEGEQTTTTEAVEGALDVRPGGVLDEDRTDAYFKR
jgi:hypothetical protein